MEQQHPTLAFCTIEEVIATNDAPTSFGTYTGAPEVQCGPHARARTEVHDSKLEQPPYGDQPELSQGKWARFYDGVVAFLKDTQPAFHPRSLVVGSAGART